MPERYAIYYAPEAGSDLEDFGTDWLGRRADSHLHGPAPELGSLPESLWRELTETARHYAFHATLKPPFALGSGVSATEVLDKAESFAASCEPIELGELELRKVGSFLALTASREDEVRGLAASCLREFEPFRTDESEEEIAKRRAKGLTPRQDKLLSAWGYPYVLDEFRFHLTLTDPIRDPEIRHKFMTLLMKLSAEIRPVKRKITEICVFHQTERQSPFVLMERFPFGKQA